MPVQYSGMIVALPVEDKCGRPKMSEFQPKLPGRDVDRGLSPREQQVARLVATGLSNKEVARQLGLTEGTVKLHVHSVFRKLGLKARYSLILGRSAEPGSHSY